MGVDTIKAAFTYLIALVVVVGGLGVVFFTTESDTKAIAAGFIGSALTFVFSGEVSTRATRAGASSLQAGIDSQYTPGTPTTAPAPITPLAPPAPVVVDPVPPATVPLDGNV